jgi:hypothetical protein
MPEDNAVQNCLFCPLQTKKEKPEHKIIICCWFWYQVTKQNASAMISKQDFDDASGDEKDEERESLRKISNEVFVVCSFHQMTLRLANREE